MNISFDGVSSDVRKQSRALMKYHHGNSGLYIHSEAAGWDVVFARPRKCLNRSLTNREMLGADL